MKNFTRPAAASRNHTSSVEFFNRRKEMDLLTTGITEGKPTFNIITGPVNSGKSKILNVLNKRLKAQHIPVLNINLRSISFNSVDNLVSTLEKEGSTWMEEFKDAAKHFQLDAKGYSFHLTAGIRREMESPIIRLNNLLHSFESKLPHYTFWYGARAPVVIVDEANELAALIGDDEGDKALHNFFKWLILNTKERNRFHVLLSSSDSFFHLWVSSRYIGSTRYETYVRDR